MTAVFLRTLSYIRNYKQKPRLPQPVPLNGRERSVPYFFIGDEAFPSSENLMKVYPGNIQRTQKKEFSITGSAEPEEL